MKIGSNQFSTPLILAPMAGVTDRPFRTLCHQLGASFCVSEMVTTQQHLWHTKKTRLRLNHDGEPGLRSVQIAGTEPKQMAAAAIFNAKHGAQIIDINMGCPAKKVCHVMAGAALMKTESRVAAILKAVVNAVNLPVTLKIRTGWDKSNRNALTIAKIAEDNGVAALTIHGRTRHCAYRGDAEYDTIAEVKASISIPVIANGDISNAEKARQVLDYTNADALMIGRAAQGNPWIFREIRHYLDHGNLIAPPESKEILFILLKHLKNLYTFYGEQAGVRIARKHIAWYCKNQAQADAFKKRINVIEDSGTQLELVTNFFTTNHFISKNKSNYKTR